MTKQEKAAAAALIDALKVSMILLAAAKQRGENIPYDQAHAALTLAREAGLK